MKLDISTWEEFAVSSIFEIRNGRGITAEEIAENPGTLKAVQSGEENNGVMGSISAGYCAEMNYVYSESMCLTVARTGTAGFVSFQPDGCVAGDSAKLLLLKHKEPTVAVLLFLQVVLQQLRFKYSYGRKVTELKYSSEAIDLPVQRNADGAPVVDGTHRFHPEGYVPDWQFMENYIRSLNHQPITTVNSAAAVSPLVVLTWGEFVFGDLISEIYKGKPHTKDELDPVLPTGDTSRPLRYITRTAENNGCEMLVVRDPSLEGAVEAGNAISIGDTTATCFYQSGDFITGDHMVVVRAEWLNTYTGVFVTTLLNAEAYRYSYGRAFIMSSIRNTRVRLPIQRDADGDPLIDDTHQFHPEGYTPDWRFIEDYMRSLPYGDSIPEVGEC